jgi:hypothetical protein
MQFSGEYRDGEPQGPAAVLASRDDRPAAWPPGNGTVLASNGHIHDALLELVRDLPYGRDYQSFMQPRPS